MGRAWRISVWWKGVLSVLVVHLWWLMLVLMTLDDLGLVSLVVLHLLFAWAAEVVGVGVRRDWGGAGAVDWVLRRMGLRVWVVEDRCLRMMHRCMCKLMLLL